MKYIRRVEQLRFCSKKLPQIISIFIYGNLIPIMIQSIFQCYVLDIIDIMSATVTIIWSFKLGKVNEIYKEGKTIKILFRKFIYFHQVGGNFFHFQGWCNKYFHFQHQSGKLIHFQGPSNIYQRHRTGTNGHTLQDIVLFLGVNPWDKLFS